MSAGPASSPGAGRSAGPGGPLATRLKGPSSVARALPEEPAGEEVRPTARAILGALVQRILHPRPVVLESRRPIEVAVVTEVKRLWANGQREKAVRYACDSVIADLQRGYAVRFPPDWTHEDILVRGVTPEMGPIPDFLAHLVRLYEPVRYGGLPSETSASPVPLVESIYSQPAMWGLYLAHVPVAGGPSDALAGRVAGTSAAPTAPPSSPTGASPAGPKA